MERITHGSPETRSADVVAENLERLKELIPEAFAEGEIDFDVLKQFLGNTAGTGEEKYGLGWHGKRRSRQLALTPSTCTLRPCTDESVEWKSTKNVMIEGDNLEVLKLLQKSYGKKVKLIYIDPPYNTGNDFVYSDNYGDGIQSYLEFTGQVDAEGRKVSSNSESSGRFHTTWLNMMYPRIMIARNLLSDDGVIVVSIDAHEFFNLRCLLDSIFGEENLVAEICVSLNPKGRQMARFFATSHEYLVIYAKRIDVCAIRAQSRHEVNEEDYRYSDAEGRFRLQPLRNTNKKYNPQTRPNLHYPLYVDEESGDVSCEGRKSRRKVLPVFGDGNPAVWRWSKRKVEHDGQELIARLIKGRQGERWDVFQKVYLTEESTKKLKTVWQSKDVGSTDDATAELKNLIGLSFDSPKPTRLIQQIIRLMPSDSLVLDFFAGSGTTGHAVMNECVADQGTRRYLLVQIPQSVDSSNDSQGRAAAFCDMLGKPRNIAELTKERLRRVVERIKDENPAFTGDLGFRVFKLDKSNIRTWDETPDDLEGALMEHINHIRPNRGEQDILYELLLKSGLDLCVSISTRIIAGKTVHVVGAGSMIACLDETITCKDVEALASGIADWWDELASTGEIVGVFRDSAFADDIAKTNLIAILEQRGIRNVQSL